MSSSTQLVFALSHAATQMTKRLDANLSIHGISFSEYQVLHFLSESPKSMLPRVELARLVGLSASGITRMLAPMEKIGLVAKESHPRDARLSLVKLSDAGTSIYEDASATVNHVASGFMEVLSDDQRQALARLNEFS